MLGADFESVEGGECNPPGVWRLLQSNRDGSATIRK